MSGDKVIFVTSGQTCSKIRKHSSHEVNEHASSQEESDTRLLLHVTHAADHRYQSVIVVSEDTDVFILLLAFAKDIPATLYQKRRSKTRTQFVEISQLRPSLGNDVCGALFRLNSFSGCDSVRAFVGKDKTECAQTKCFLESSLLLSTHGSCRLTHLKRYNASPAPCIFQQPKLLW